MIIPRTVDAVHKAWMYRLLAAISENSLSRYLAFKGGTAAAMLGYLDRFSVDLDFDYLSDESNFPFLRSELEIVFGKLCLEIKDSSSVTPQYFLKYPVNHRQHGLRNTLKLDITYPPPEANKYEMLRFSEIDRIINCQTIETMFANKLVALLDRFERNNSIAGRDLYDIHHYFMNGYRYEKKVIEERRAPQNLIDFFTQLVDFIEQKITAKIIKQDLNMLMPNESFQRIRKVIKAETLMFLRDELILLR